MTAITPARSLRRGLAILAAAALAAGPGSGEAAGQQAWIRVVGGSTYEFQPDADSVVLAVPLELVDSIDRERVRFTLLNARAGNRQDRRIRGGFAVAPALEADSAAEPSLLVTVRPDSLLDFSAYTLDIRARGGAQAVTFTLTVTRPRAALDVPDSLVIERGAGFWGTERATPLLLREDSGRASVSGIRLQTPAFTAADAAPASIRIVARGLDTLTLGAGQQAVVDYAIEGSAPLGVSRGTARIVAPQLAAPVQLPIVVRQRRPLWTLAAAILLGLLVGFVIRVVLQSRRERGEAQLQAFALAERMRREMQRSGDAEFAAAVRNLVEDLERNAEIARAADITSATEAAKTELDAKLKKLEERLGDAREGLEKLEEVTGKAYSLPDAMEAAVAEARRQEEAARAALLARDAGRAADRVARAGKGLSRSIGEILPRWRAGLDAGYRALFGSEGWLPKSVHSRFEAVGSGLIREVAAIAAPPPDGDADGIDATLSGVHAHRVAALGVLLKLPDPLARLAEQIRAALPALGEPPEMAALRAEIDALNDDVRAARSLEPLLARCNQPRLREAFPRALRAYARAAGQPETTIDEKLRQRDYLGAAALLARAAQRREQGAGETLLGEEAGGGFASGVRDTRDPAVTREAVAPPASQARPGLALDSATLPPLSVRKARTTKQLIAVKAVQFGLALVGLTVIGVLLYGERYFGSFSELSAAFLWAFGLDITIDTTVETGKKLREAQRR